MEGIQLFNKNDRVVLRYNTQKYRQGQKAVVVSCPSKKDETKVDVRFEDELYIDDETDTYPMSLFENV